MDVPQKLYIFIILNLIINGENKSFDENISLLEIIRKLQVEDKVMALAVNMEIVKQEDWNNYTPKDGDKLELLNFVGGG